MSKEITKEVEKELENNPNLTEAEIEAIIEKKLSAKKIGKRKYNESMEDGEEDKPNKWKLLFNSLIDLGKKKISSIEITKLAMMSEGDAGAGGVMTPTIVNDEIHLTLDKASVLRRIIPPENIIKLPTGKTFDWPVDGNNEFVFSQGEAVAIPTGALSSTKVSFSPKYINALIPFTDDLAEDSVVPILPYITTKSIYGIGRKEDQMGLSGSTTFTKGILADSTIPTVSAAGVNSFEAFTTASISADDFADMVTVMEKANTLWASNAVWLGSAGAKGVIKKLKDGQNNYLWTNANFGIPGAGEEYRGVKIDGYFFGKPWITINNALPDPTIVSGSTSAHGRNLGVILLNPDEMGMVVKRDVEVVLGTEATVGGFNTFEQNMKAIKTVERVDIGMLSASAAVKYISR